MATPLALSALAEELAKLPTIGHKTARRLAFQLATGPKSQPQALAQALLRAAEALCSCKRCGGLSEQETCPLCLDPARDLEVLLVVEDARNVFTIEESGIYRGQYHVLGGAINPMRGIGPQQLNILSLQARLAGGQIKELVLATNPTMEGEATAHYLTDLLQGQVPSITRIARGMPTGGDLEYADQGTLAKAIEGRTRFG